MAPKLTTHVRSALDCSHQACRAGNCVVAGLGGVSVLVDEPVALGRFNDM